MSCEDDVCVILYWIIELLLCWMLCGMVVVVECVFVLIYDWVLGEGVVGLGFGEKEMCGRIGIDIVLKFYVEKKLL